MEKREFEFQGMLLNGFLMLLVVFVVFAGGLTACIMNAECETSAQVWGVVAGILLVLCSAFLCFGFLKQEPNMASVLMFFGRYRGTFTRTGFYWLNPLITAKRLSLRARNLDAEPIKVNDKIGNPVLIGQMLVWKLKDTYKATFEIDAQQAQAGALGQGSHLLMAFYENFVKIQGDAALRKVAGEYAYDDTDGEANEQTLRGGGDALNEMLEQELRARLDMAGIEVLEARINYLAYAPEIAAVMLRRQQASAIITAREKIVEGAVSMVKMALEKLSEEEVVELDDDKKAAMVSNLMVVLCGDDTVQPVVNTGTLNM